MRVAFATQDLVTVDAHLGWCRHLVVHEVTGDAERRVAAHAFPEAREDGDEDKLGPRLAALEGCAIVYATAIGGSAAARLRSARVHPARVEEGRPIPALLEELRRVLAGSPPPWLRRVLQEAGGAPAADAGGQR